MKNKTLIACLGTFVASVIVSDWIHNWRETNRLVESGKALHDETEKLIKQLEEDKKNFIDTNKNMGDIENTQRLIEQLLELDESD